MNLLCDTNIILDVLLITCASAQATRFSKKNCLNSIKNLRQSGRPHFISDSLDFRYKRNYNEHTEEGFTMATKSILKNVNIQGRRRVHDFVNALERSIEQPEKEVLLQHPVVEIHADRIKSFLRDYER